jgi:hypothetical protein
VEDVVEPIIFLLSDRSQMINGVSLPIGMYINIILKTRKRNEFLPHFLIVYIDGGFLAT